MNKISGRTKKIINFIGKDKNYKILDLGCSGGYQTDELGEIKYGFDTILNIVSKSPKGHG